VTIQETGDYSEILFYYLSIHLKQNKNTN